MEKKYELTDVTIEVNGHVLRQIVALKNFRDVKRGDLGGFIEYEDNLSHEGNCWVYRDGIVYENAEVRGNARILGQVHGNSQVKGNAIVYQGAVVTEFAIVDGHASIEGVIKGRAHIVGHASIGLNVTIDGDAVVGRITRLDGKEHIEKTSDVLVIGPIGSRDDYLTVYIKSGNVITGCFYGTLDQLKEEATKQNRQDYLDLIPGIRAIMKRRRTT